MKHYLAPALLLVSISLGAAAHAQTANGNYSSLNVGQYVEWTFGSTTRTTWAGNFFLKINSADGPMAGFAGSNILVFCPDPIQYIDGTPTDFTQTPMSGLQLFATNGAAKEAAVKRLLGFSADAHNTTADANYATAFQLALWEIIGDYDGTAGSLNALGGNYYFSAASLGGNAAAVQTNLTAMLNAAGNVGGAQTTDDIYTIRSETAQDLIHTVPNDRIGDVPEPGEWAAMGVLGTGLCGLVVRARRKRSA